MKFTTLVLTAAAATTAVANQHNHMHHHMHGLKKRTKTETSWVAGPTAYAFMLDGQAISVDEVCSGIKDNKLKWGNGANAPSDLCSSAAPTTTTTTTTSAAPTAAAFYQQSSSSAAPSSSGSSYNSNGSGVDSDFPDGQIDCGSFPSQYGPVHIDYLGLNGWIGLQKPTWGVNTIVDLFTSKVGSGDNCKEGDMCSYACPPGYQKSQWPSTQGATGQSVGGLECKNGKLHLTNSQYSKLCIPGQGGVQAINKASGVVAICRTDYPGTESETIPTEIQPGQTQQLTNPAADYFVWKDPVSGQMKQTSAQYYLNDIGVPASQGCQWGEPGSNKGNYASINLGVGYKDGKTWLSIFQNAPTNLQPYAGKVVLSGDISDKCYYQNGQFCGATGCNANGCTVAVLSGTATYEVSN